ncbi:MAG: hypothetical protein L0Y77_11625 [Chlorobi bacterium]|nr:hypothetical protein [Chlorobiota bacterium]
MNDKYSLKMSLAKREYKKYEPVIAQFELVNHDSNPMPIYNLFEEDSEEPGVIVIDEKGNKLEINNGVKAYFVPWIHTILQPGDTLIISMAINNWGSEASPSEKWLDYDDNIYFGEFGYFEPGNYKAYFYFNNIAQERYSTSLQSNEVEFTVKELSEEDKNVLKLYRDLRKQRKFDKITLDYPDNIFSEHVYARNLLTKYLGKTSYNTIEVFNNFVNKYPNSFYLLDWNFLSIFLKSASDFKGNHQEGINLILNIQTSETLKRVLKNRAFLRYIFPDIEE